MKEFTIDTEQIRLFQNHLQNEERSEGTIDKYISAVSAFAAWLEERELNKEAARAWKSDLTKKGLRPVSVNAKLAAVNGFFSFLGREDCRMKYLKVQRKMFRDTARDLSRQEYCCLIKSARSRGKERLALTMECICATGIRVSELKYITREAAAAGRTEVALKGKIRTILLPGKLCRKLLKYADKNKIASGEIFLTGSGKSLSRGQIWAEMKKVCRDAHVEESKVFPHNLRHLFAVTFYKACRDVVRLADVLGHSSVETTRIYLLTTGSEQMRQIEQLRLIC